MFNIVEVACNPRAIAAFDIECNTPLSEVANNIWLSSNRTIPWIDLLDPHDRDALICAGGPSLRDSLPEIKQRQKNGAYVVGMNGSSQWMVDNGVIPDATVMIDCHPKMKNFVLNFPSNAYFLASQCDDGVFHHLKMMNVKLFHIDIPDIGRYVPTNGRTIQAVGGGSCVGLITMSLMYTQGFRKLHLYGYDSSLSEGEQHVYQQKTSDEVIKVSVAGREFLSTPYLVTQVNQWQKLIPQLINEGCGIITHGTGLLPYVAWLITNIGWMDTTLTT